MTAGRIARAKGIVKNLSKKFRRPLETGGEAVVGFRPGTVVVPIAVCGRPAVGKEVSGSGHPTSVSASANDLAFMVIFAYRIAGCGSSTN